MAERVTCVAKGESEEYSDCRCITSLGVGTKRYSRSEAHALVTRQPGALYVGVGESKAKVVPVEREGLKYVRTAPNDTTSDNLLSLPEC